LTPATESTQGWIVQTTTSPEEGRDGHADATLARVRVLINAAGLGAASVLNEVLPLSRHIPLYYACGAYAAYRGPGVRDIKHVYPADEASVAKSASFHSLGTHLTLDMGGNVRFGPDIDWLSVP
ncbi:hypothetical protein EDB85DRAFT_1838084, partial [Lactarius pseudohatsudake]